MLLQQNSQARASNPDSAVYDLDYSNYCLCDDWSSYLSSHVHPKSIQQLYVAGILFTLHINMGPTHNFIVKGENE